MVLILEDKQLIQQYTFWRYRTIQSLDATTEEQSDMLPAGFTNTVRWNLGHVLVTVEFVLNRFAKVENFLPDNYARLFKAGTRPNEWTEEPPSLTELKQYLLEQIKQVQELEGQLNESVATEFSIGSYLTLETIGELLLFLMNHENLHLGTINGIKRASGIKELWSVATV